MSATSFGGSFNLVKTDDRRFKDLFLQRSKRVVLDSQFPVAKYLPFVPSPSTELIELSDEMINRRLAWTGLPKKDILQILIDTNRADPVSFSRAHIHQEMILFM